MKQERSSSLTDSSRGQVQVREGSDSARKRKADAPDRSSTKRLGELWLRKLQVKVEWLCCLR